jgi:hypothetical protein
MFYDSGHPYVKTTMSVLQRLLLTLHNDVFVFPRYLLYVKDISESIALIY